MQSRVELVALIATGGLAAAFAVSFFAGLGGRDASRSEVAREVADRPAVEAAPLPAERIRVEVLNASEQGGLARAVTDRLREAGYDVVYFGNAAQTDSSVVLVRTEAEVAARTLAARIGIANVRMARDTTSLLDLTVVLGRDFSDPSRARR